MSTELVNMLSQCEFNGRKDVLHFKLLQAALDENKANKNADQNRKNKNENEMRENFEEDDDEISNGYEKFSDENRYTSKDRRFSSSEDVHRDLFKKREKRSPLALLESSKRQYENPFLTPRIDKSTNRMPDRSHTSLPLSKSKRMRRNLSKKHTASKEL